MWTGKRFKMINNITQVNRNFCLDYFLHLLVATSTSPKDKIKMTLNIGIHSKNRFSYCMNHDSFVWRFMHRIFFFFIIIILTFIIEMSLIRTGWFSGWLVVTSDQIEMIRVPNAGASEWCKRNAFLWHFIKKFCLLKASDLPLSSKLWAKTSDLSQNTASFN